jgi:hypothetical protein
MKIQISEKLNSAYIAAHKNHNYALNFLLSSIDSDTCAECFKLIGEFKLLGDRIAVEIDESNLTTIQGLFENADNDLIEQLLWVAILFPEI